jgi:hypothetical protein
MTSSMTDSIPFYIIPIILVSSHLEISFSSVKIRTERGPSSIILRSFSQLKRLPREFWSKMLI